MFADAFLPNLAFFASGQLAAWGYLRTGMLRLGTALLAAMLVLADWALVARFAYQDVGPGYLAPLLAMQGLGAMAALVFAWGRLRRRFGPLARRRKEVFGEGLGSYLRGDYAAAARSFARLAAHDRWDVPSTVALANSLRRLGRLRRARRLYKLARSLDRRGDYHDFVAEQLRRCAQG